MLEVQVDPAGFAAREPVRHVQPRHGLGRELFAPFRAGVSAAEAGASIFYGGETT